MIMLTDADYDRVVTGSGHPVLLAFGRADDPGSAAMVPILTALDKAFTGRLVTVIVDVPYCRSTAARWGIARLPTLVVLRHGVAERVLRGVRPLPRLVREITEVLTPAPSSR